MTHILNLQQPKRYGTLIKRYKRFLCDVTLDSGDVITAHCPNPGRMISCSAPGSRVRLTYFDDPKRKYAHRLDLVHNGNCWIGVNPNLANDIVAAAIAANHCLPELNNQALQREVRYHDRSRVDFFHDDGGMKTFVEVKSVTYADDEGVGYFPDAVSKRATQHLRALQAMITEGHRAVVVYCVQRADIQVVQSAKHIDPQYSDAVDEAKYHGVEFITLSIGFDVDGDAVCLSK